MRSSPICQVDEHDLIYDENGGYSKLAGPSAEMRKMDGWVY
jgi:hypothetical protein